MSANATNLLSRLEDLKKWQQTQQERLLKQQGKYKNEENKTTTPTIVMSQKDIEQQPVGQKKTFEQLLEEKLLIEDHNKKKEIQNKPKQPYLKKGSGLNRYKMSKTIAHQTTKQKQLTPLKTPDIHFETKENDLPGEQTLYENALEKELMIFEALEQRASNSSFCSTNSSVVRILSSTPDKNSQLKTIENQQETIDNNQQETNGLKLKPMLLDYLLKCSSNVYTRDDGGGNIKLSNIDEHELEFGDSTLKALNFNDNDKWSDDDKSSSDDLSDLIIEKRSIGIMTDVVNDGVETESDVSINDEILQEKIQELDREIKAFRCQNAELHEARRDFEQQKMELNRTRKKLEQEVEAEKEEIHNHLEEEKKKLAKEKMVFERYVKESQNRPSRKEREEISLLKNELANLKETLKCKETKNSTTQARLRNQIKHLEKENSELKDEIDKLRKQNAKLTVSTVTRKTTDTKVLHEINRNLTKLAQKKNKRLSSSSRKCSSSDDSSSDSLDEKFKTEKQMKRVGDVSVDTEPVKENHNSSESTKKQLNLKKQKNNKENVPDSDIERSYEEMFKSYSTESSTSERQSVSDSIVSDEKVERILEDGSKEIKYINGNVKIVSSDGNLIKMNYFNKDVKETNLLKGTIRYFFNDTKTWHTTFADGTELLEFDNGQVERKYKDGTCEVRFSNGTVKKVLHDGTQEVTYPDGSVVQIKNNGEKLLLLSNGQKEIHTEEYKRREYPDGTVKTLYPNGLQETKYANGRIRVKDKDGKLLMDSHG